MFNDNYFNFLLVKIRFLKFNNSSWKKIIDVDLLFSNLNKEDTCTLRSSHIFHIKYFCHYYNHLNIKKYLSKSQK